MLAKEENKQKPQKIDETIAGEGTRPATVSRCINLKIREKRKEEKNNEEVPAPLVVFICPSNSQK